MRRLVTRLVIVGVVILAVWLFSYIRDNIGECPNSRVEAWFTNSTKIMEGFDYYNIQAAENSYKHQQTLNYPQCVSILQKYTVNFFYNIWQSDKARESGDFLMAKFYADEAVKADSDMQQETDRLGIKYGWQK
jgi:hypothetical protein